MPFKSHIAGCREVVARETQAALGAWSMENGSASAVRPQDAETGVTTGLDRDVPTPTKSSHSSAADDDQHVHGFDHAERTLSYNNVERMLMHVVCKG